MIENIQTGISMILIIIVLIATKNRKNDRKS